MLASSTTTSDDEGATWLNDTGAEATIYARVFLWSGTCNSYDWAADLVAPPPPVFR